MKVNYSKSMTAAVMMFFAISLPLYASQLDDRIESSAKQSYVFKTYLKDDNIKIDSRNGDVTLSGVVNEEFHKSLAQETLTGYPGVKSVTNKLKVKGKAPAENSDAWLRDKVEASLLFHRSVSATKTDVAVNNAIVTLRGEAASQAQKDLTTEYSRDVEGVVDVINKMTVVKIAKNSRSAGEKIDDASITAQVKTSLLYHRSTSAISTKVETRGGVVTLYGKAKNMAEFNLVSKLVNDVNGVTGVNNRMVIE